MLVRGSVIDAADLDRLMSGPESQTSHDEPIDWLAGDLPTALARLEEAMIRRALAATNGNRTEAARRLGIQRQLLYAKLERYGLDRAQASENTTPPVRKADA